MHRHLARAAVALSTALALAGALTATSADAIVKEVPTGSSPIMIGAQPRSASLLDGRGASVKTFDNAKGNPVMHANATYAIYWDPEYGYHGDWQHLIDTFLQDVGSQSGTLSNVYAVDSQYTDATNQRAAYSSTFHGATVDTKPYPTSDCVDPDTVGGYAEPSAQLDNVACLTDKQLQEELRTIISQNKLQTGMGTIFYLLTPPGVTVCTEAGGSLTSYCSDTRGSPNGFCSYHSAISPTSPVEGNAETILYAVIPWTAGGLGDYHLIDQSPAYECQDGGYDPSSKPIEEKEHPKPRTEAEEVAFTKMSPEEKKKVEEREAHESPHQQEPNQAGLGPDGSFDTGLADLIINQVAVEQQNTVTDPLLNAWHDSAGNESTDECRDFFAYAAGGEVTEQEKTEAGNLYNQVIGAGHYYLNDAFDLAALKQGYPGIPCLPGARLEPQFTSPNPVNAGEIVGFDGAESDTTLDAGEGFGKAGPYLTYPTYSWNFGDDSQTTSSYPPGASPVDMPSVFHSYQYGGTYQVTLTVTDTGGNTESVTEPITVIGAQRPSPTPTPSNTTPGGSSGSGSSSSGGSGGGSSQAQTGATSSVSAPVVTASISSTSLKNVKHSGIAVHYTVNEQVAGSVQVLLESSVAKRLGIKGPAATGLATGSPSEIVIGTAVIVTTKAGAGTVHIKLASKTAARLARSHKLKLMLRLVARNASHTHPLSTTMLSTVVLSG
jgi:hypothetical protein